MRRWSTIKKPDSKQIVHSSCWRSMLDDTFLCLLIAEGIKWATKVFSFSSIKDRKSGSSKKVCRDLYQYACVKGLKADLAACCLSCIYSAPHVLQFPLMTSNSWGKKVCLFSFPCSSFLSVFNYWWGLFVCLFPSDTSEFTHGCRVGCADDRSDTEIPPESGWHFFNTHSGLKRFSGCKQKGICKTKLCRPAKYGVLLESHMIFS